MKYSLKMLGAVVLCVSPALLATPGLVQADDQFWPVSAPVYAERHPTMPPVTIEDPTVSTKSGAPATYTPPPVQETPHPDIFVMPAVSPVTPTVQPSVAVTASASAAQSSPTVMNAASILAAAIAEPTAKSCESTSPACEQACCQCSNMFDHRTGVFAEYLYLRAFDIDMAHGVQQNGVGGQGTVTIGDVATAQPGFSSGYRVGAEWACCCCSEIKFTYTQYETGTTSLLDAAGGVGGTAASLVLFPTTVTSADTYSTLFATYNIEFQTADIDYSTLLCGNNVAKMDFVFGARYAHLQQDFTQSAESSGANGSKLTTTTIGFDGVGMRTGLTGQWQLGNTRLALYGRGYLDVLFGDFVSDYTQFNLTTSTTEANAHWVDGRVLPILETEFGLEWTCCSDCCRFSVGYDTSYWFNAIDTGEFIQAVQNESFTHAAQTIAFTGVAARAEVRF
jgi:Legionella pneumophila major outer membrane protein precursor